MKKEQKALFKRAFASLGLTCKPENCNNPAIVLLAREFRCNVEELLPTEEEIEQWNAEEDLDAPSASPLEIICNSAHFNALSEKMAKNMFAIKRDRVYKVFSCVDPARRIVHCHGTFDISERDKMFDVIYQDYKNLARKHPQIQQISQILGDFIFNTLVEYTKRGKNGVKVKALIPERIKGLAYERLFEYVRSDADFVFNPIAKPKDTHYAVVKLSPMFALAYDKAMANDASVYEMFPCLYSWFSVINKANLEDIEDSFLAFCRYLGKIIARLSGDKVTNYREIFFLRGGGETGITTLCRAIASRFRDISVALDDLLENTNTHSMANLVDKYIGILTECHKRIRLIDYPLVRRVTSGDYVTVNEKFKSAYSTELSLSLIFGSNAYPAVNIYKTDEMSRFYLVDTAHIPHEFKRADIDERYAEEMDAFLGFCYASYCKFKEKDVGGSLYKPKKMLETILSKCLTDACIAMADFADLYRLAVEAGATLKWSSPHAIAQDFVKIYRDIDIKEVKEILVRLLESKESPLPVNAERTKLHTFVLPPVLEFTSDSIRSFYQKEIEKRKGNKAPITSSNALKLIQ